MDFTLKALYKLLLWAGCVALAWSVSTHQSYWITGLILYYICDTIEHDRNN